MPTCRRKRVLLTEPSPELLQLAQSNPAREVFYLEQTGEIFESYEAYAARMSFYRMKQFQCEVTGKSNLDYFQAVESELSEARTLHSRFPEPLKPAVLRAVQWQVMGRLDHLVEAVYERFKDRYWPEERVFVDIQGEKFYAKVLDVFPPNKSASMKTNNDMSSPTRPFSQPTVDLKTLHNVTGDLKISAKEAMANDDPAKYTYKIQIIEEEKEKSDKNKGHAKDASKSKWNGSLMDVQPSSMSRDRLGFSKSILRRFIRDCVDRDAPIMSPWTVKPPLAKRYGISTVMPEETRKGVESLKKGEIDKRKKVWEDKEGPATKKKKLTATQEEKAAKQAAAAAAAAEAAAAKQEPEALDAAAKEEAERLATMEKKKKKPVRYPTEDLDVRLSERDKKAGARLLRPVPNRNVPFGDMPAGTFEAFLMAWNFVICYGQALHISTFTLDEFEHALRHTVAEIPCTILSEIHSVLIYNLRTVTFTKHSAILSMQYEDEEAGMSTEVMGVSTDTLVTALGEVSNNWERVPLRHSEGRVGWEDAIIGCLKDHATQSNLPRLREILTRLLFVPNDPIPSSGASSSSATLQDPPNFSNAKIGDPSERYYALPPDLRIAILYFMCNLAVTSKAVHTHMENCEEQLTNLRKEKIEIGRQKKQMIEEIATLAGEGQENEEKQKESPSQAAPAPEPDVSMHADSSDLSDPEGGSENGSEAALSANNSNVSRRSTARQKDLMQKKAQAQAHAKQRELARQKANQVKQAQVEQRRLEEELARVERRLESIEREFRKLLGVVRVRPLGRDRFYNRIWWFDGMGAASLLGSGGTVQYGAGRVFIQGPSEFDIEILERREEKDVDERRLEEEGAEGMLGSDEWGMFTEQEDVEALMSWLNPKGVRELALKNTMTKWWGHIGPGIRKRTADVSMVAKLPDARRSARTNHVGGHDLSREPYMLWTNRKATSAS